MTSLSEFERLYEEWVERPSAEYRRLVGPSVDMDAAALEQFIQHLSQHRTAYPNIAFWVIFDYKTFSVLRSDGNMNVLGSPLRTKRDLLQHIHPDYLLPYLRWRKGAYNLVFQYADKMRKPLQHAFRISLPLRVRSGRYWWFLINSLTTQLDANHRIVSNLQTFCQENEWSRHNLRPVEAAVFSRTEEESLFNSELTAQISLQLTELFTDAELDLLALYAAGKSTEQVLAVKRWSKHTLHEYNTHLLRKSKELFVYDFKSARHFAEYCRERRILYFKM